MRTSLELSIHYLNKVRERGGREGRDREGSDVRYYVLVVHALYTTNINCVLAGYNTFHVLLLI